MRPNQWDFLGCIGTATLGVASWSITPALTFLLLGLLLLALALVGSYLSARGRGE